MRSIQRNGPIATGQAGRLNATYDPLLLLLFDRLGLMELGGKLLAGPLAEGLFDELAGIPARLPGEALGLDRGFALGADDDFDDLHAAPPATWMVSLIEPSASCAQ